jgi:hypothetical protein
MDFLAHLHPDQESPSTSLGTGPSTSLRTGRNRFVQELPSMPDGRFRVFADIVHGTGFPETEIGSVTLPRIVGGLPRGDDSLAITASLATGPQTGGAPLGGGARMRWINDAEPLRAGEPIWLKFRVDAPSGQPATDLEPYMGMPGHLVVVRADWSVFAHLHPAGSAPMASVELANGPAMATHAGHAQAAEITFPYGFPSAGHYRLFVQIKRAGRVETGVFDAQVK